MFTWSNGALWKMKEMQLIPTLPPIPFTRQSTCVWRICISKWEEMRESASNVVLRGLLCGVKRPTLQLPRFQQWVGIWTAVHPHTGILHTETIEFLLFVIKRLQCHLQARSDRKWRFVIYLSWLKATEAVRGSGSRRPVNQTAMWNAHHLFSSTVATKVAWKSYGGHQCQDAVKPWLRVWWTPQAPSSTAKFKGYAGEHWGQLNEEGFMWQRALAKPWDLDSTPVEKESAECS